MSIPKHLGPAELDALAHEIDALRAEVIAQRGDADRRYILRVIRTQRGLDLGGRLLVLVAAGAWAAGGLWPYLLCAGIGALAIGLAKILENMEIAHNVLHAQWDWMADPRIHSKRWEWDHICPAEQWRRSHNHRHHTWTNVVGRDPDVGYGLLRITPSQRWRPFYLGQVVYASVLAVLFEWGVAIQELELGRLFTGRSTWAEVRPMLRATLHKVARQYTKDYVLWPCLAVLVALPLMAVAPALSVLMTFVGAALALVAANLLRNLWTYAIIFCGHFPADVHVFTKQEIEGESRGGWYARQILGSCNIEGGPLFHVLSGNLSHQIEHHLFPDLPSNRYVELAPRVRALAQRYGLAYNSASFPRQLGTTVWKIVRLGFPGGASLGATTAPAVSLATPGVARR